MNELSTRRKAGHEMDMDKLLKQWDELKKQEARKPKNTIEKAPGKVSGEPRRPEEKKERSIHDQLGNWITIHGVEDKDSEYLDDEGQRSAAEAARRFRLLEPQAVLDLHGYSAAEAEPLLERFLQTSARKGLEKVLVIHGKGNHSTTEHVMTDLTRRVLERNKNAGSFGPADRRHGGRGATWVKIRN